MPSTEWILDVCKDLRSFAEVNSLNGVAEALELTLHIARREIAQKKGGLSKPTLSATMMPEGTYEGQVIPFDDYKARQGN